MRLPFRYWPQKWIPGNIAIVPPQGSTPAPYLGVDVTLTPDEPLASQMVPGKYMTPQPILFNNGAVEVDNNV